VFIEYMAFVLFGLVFGSFCNVLIYRLPRNIPIGLSRSCCNNCGTEIRSFDNIPVISFLVLRGKCRACGSGISARYPIIEISTSFLWVLPLILGQPLLEAAFSALFTTALLVIAVADFECLIVPDSMVIAIAVLSIPGLAMQLPPHWLDRLIGAFAAGAFFYLLAVLSERILKKEGMGGGDIKLIAAGGLFLGWQLIALAIGLGAILALPAMILMRALLHKFNSDKQLPFAPPLAIAMVISHYFGTKMIHWYLFSAIGFIPIKS